jgi:hypothetical protein
VVGAGSMTRWSAPIGLGLLTLGAFALVLREQEAAAARPSTSEPSPPEPSLPAGEPPTPIAPSAAAAEPAALSATPRRTPTFDLLEDGSAVPALDAAAPRRVKVGVALFRYRGAEGAGAQTRTREEAHRLATAALAQGGGDFGQVVALADPGSAVDVGWVGRGVLERGVEYPVFTAKVGETLPRPIDTPRGYWVVRRHK